MSEEQLLTQTTQIRDGKRHAIGEDDAHTLCGRMIRAGWTRQQEGEVECSSCLAKLTAPASTGRRLVNLDSIVLSTGGWQTLGEARHDPETQGDRWYAQAYEMDHDLFEDYSDAPKLFWASFLGLRTWEYDAWEACDAKNSELEAIASVILDPETRHMRQDLFENVEGYLGDVLIVERVDLSEEFRGSALGRLLTGYALQRLGGGYGLAVLQPSERDVKAGGYSRKTRKIISDIWADLGFEPYGGLMILDLTGNTLRDAVERLEKEYQTAAEAPHELDPAADPTRCRRCGWRHPDV